MFFLFGLLALINDEQRMESQYYLISTCSFLKLKKRNFNLLKMMFEARNGFLSTMLKTI